ncbi:MAG: hypothetical protein UU21_C0001G0126 [Candidatus Levybacteria bacterium GW2011_GWA2_40_8]|nr:MAG: hypothetical protein UU21_C0001G0126 [Candidatus Levybacteria bacterium GW2011_GWA2_40_8]
MLNSKAFAHAATIVTAVFYLICASLAYIAPDLIVGIGNSWVHALNLEMIRTSTQPSFGVLLYGLVTISAVTWVTTYALIELYNRLAKK